MTYEPISWKRLAMASLAPLLASSVVTIIAIYFGFDPFDFQTLHANSIAGENRVLKAQLTSLDNRLHEFALVMNQLGTSDDQLRTSVNLSPLSPDLRKVSTGGVEMNKDYGVSAEANKLIADGTATLESLDRQAQLQRDSYADIIKKYNRNQELFRHIPAIDPIRAGIMTDGFGMRLHPILHVRLMHEGIDIEAEVGTPVHATGDGVIEYVGQRGGYGKVVEINNGFGYSTLFGHLSRFLVKPGQEVKRGQVIALSGNTGLSTGPHLHYEVRRNGVHIDPASFFFDGSRYNTSDVYASLAKK